MPVTSNYSASTAETLLAIPVFYLLAEKAQPRFPHSRTSSPSERVVIAITGSIPDVHAAQFPVQVSWRQWEEAVVPVLEDADLTVRAPMFKRSSQDGRILEWVALVGKKLKASFELAGYGSGS